MRRFIYRLAGLTMVLILSACSPRAEDSGAPEQTAADVRSVAEAYYTAFNAGDAEGLKAVLAEEVTVSIDFLGQIITSSGRQAYVAQEASSFAANAQIAFSNPTVSENTFEAEHTYRVEGELLVATIRFMVEGGQITSIEIRITDIEVADELLDTLASPIGTPVGPGTSLTALDPGWTALSPGGETSCALDTPYSFWVRPGSSEELLIFLQGGGYCDSAENCSFGSPTYDSAVTEGDSPTVHPEGIFDFANAENPFLDYSMVFVPYCTGDGHMGNNIQVYEANDGTELQVNHRGFVNASSALDWVYGNFEQPESIFLAGCSAGSVGSAMHAAYVIEQYPNAALNQLGDSLAFVFDQPVNLQTGANWQDNFPEWVEGMPELMNRSFEMSEFYSLVAGHYPGVGFGQLNSLHDNVQVTTYVDFGGQEQNWVPDLDASLSAIHTNAPNFRSLTFGGSEHCMLNRPIFYTYAVEGIRLRDWVAEYSAGLDVPSARCSECDEPEIIEQ